MLWIIGSIVNVFLWMALERREVYKNSLADEGLKIEKELDSIGLHIRVFKTREKIREEGLHPSKGRKLLRWERWASTFAFRRSFLFLAMLWIFAIPSVYSVFTGFFHELMHADVYFEFMSAWNCGRKHLSRSLAP
jgi:hypothetical protein